jgi:hypothetical protein
MRERARQKSPPRDNSGPRETSGNKARPLAWSSKRDGESHFIREGSRERTEFRNYWNVDESGSVGYGLLCAVPIGIASQVDAE